MAPPRKVPYRDAVDPSWANHAACRHLDPDIFHPLTPLDTQIAKHICQGCPVRIRCLNHALDNHEDAGIWGGLTPYERRRYNRRKSA